jgi:hypothetical protein
MCRFVIMNANATAHRLGLVDAYGKWHLVHIEAASSFAPGSELHGPQAALGLHFLVVGPTGQRLAVNFEAIGLTRESLMDRLHGGLEIVAPAPRRQCRPTPKPGSRRGLVRPADFAPAPRLARSRAPAPAPLHATAPGIALVPDIADEAAMT